ncbi:hypothetical protein FOL47_003732, partial [Perkinsus chesapeaki]
PFEYGYIMSPSKIGYRSVDDQPEVNLRFVMPGTYKVVKQEGYLLGYSELIHTREMSMRAGLNIAYLMSSTSLLVPGVV